MHYVLGPAQNLDFPVALHTSDSLLNRLRKHPFSSKFTAAPFPLPKPSKTLRHSTFSSSEEHAGIIIHPSAERTWGGLVPGVPRCRRRFPKKTLTYSFLRENNSLTVACVFVITTRLRPYALFVALQVSRKKKAESKGRGGKTKAKIYFNILARPFDSAFFFLLVKGTGLTRRAPLPMSLLWARARILG